MTTPSHGRGRCANHGSQTAKVERVKGDQVEFGPFQLPDGDPEIAAQGRLLACCGIAHASGRDNYLFGHDPTVGVRPSTSHQRKGKER